MRSAVVAATAVAGSAVGLTAVATSTGGASPVRGKAAAARTAPPASGATITVTGTGKMTGRPDTLTIQLGATTTRPSAAAALDRNNAEVARIEAVLVRAGLKKVDMQTSNLQLNANTNDHGTVTGYTASDQLTVTTHHLAGAGELIDAAAHAVGNDVTIDGITYGRADAAPLLREARIKAMHQAAGEASALAAAAGGRLGGVIKVRDENPQVPVTFGVGAATPAATHSSPVPLQGGTTSVSAKVEVVYALTP